MAHRRVTGDVERERGLAHRGSCRDNNEIGRMKARKKVIKSREAGGNPTNAALPFRERLDTIPCLVNFIADRGELMRRRGIADGINAFFRLVEYLHRFARIIRSE